MIPILVKLERIQLHMVIPSGDWNVECYSPLVELMRRHSPYNCAFNNLLMFIGEGYTLVGAETSNVYFSL